MIDSTEAPEDGPSYESNLAMAVGYCILYIVIGSFFFMNLFIGVIFDEFEH